VEGNHAGEHFIQDGAKTVYIGPFVARSFLTCSGDMYSGVPGGGKPLSVIFFESAAAAIRSHDADGAVAAIMMFPA